MKPFIPEFDIIADAFYHQFSHLAKKWSQSARKRYADVMTMNEVVSKECIQLATWLQRDPGMYNTSNRNSAGTFGTELCITIIMSVTCGMTFWKPWLAHTLQPVSLVNCNS
ncbi:hypothetical protein QR680_002764 [Steinernema hermaphroditum]|uniref:Uncharacterized protein n=1 Tax=Steinernema hermaphroditum TaxID=289476 RepID=A0AA39LIT6_9BILA|nr:hypothetical protein QR680_002764 [Steinernema hermaphroditum]